MDEPFGALDAQNRELMQEELQVIWNETRKTVLFITHDIDEAIYLADRVVVFTARPGRVKADLRIDLPRPRAIEIKKSAGLRRLPQPDLGPAARRGAAGPARRGLSMASAAALAGARRPCPARSRSGRSRRVSASAPDYLPAPSVILAEMGGMLGERRARGRRRRSVSIARSAPLPSAPCAAPRPGLPPARCAGSSAFTSRSSR